MQTPCDVPIIDYDENGREVKHYECPYADTYAGYENEMCRNCCGLGVDEQGVKEYDDIRIFVFTYTTEYIPKSYGNCGN